MSDRSEQLLTTVRTFKMRSGRITESQQAALRTAAERYDLSDEPWSTFTSRAAGRPIVADIGFGFGDSLLHYAHAEPKTFIVGLEVHLPGVGALCRDAAAAGLDNIALVIGDARTWLRNSVPEASLAGVRLFFPDPWPKARHHKRRFIRAAVLDLVASRVAAGGFLHIATDWANYAEDASEELATSQSWELEPGTHRRFNRPITRFERRAINDGRPVHDLLAHKRVGDFRT